MKRRVLFVGGPDAGDVREVPAGVDEMRSVGDFVYRVYPVASPWHGGKVAYFAYDRRRDPGEMFMLMWREYSAAVQAQRGVAVPSYSSVLVR